MVARSHRPCPPTRYRPILMADVIEKYGTAFAGLALVALLPRLRAEFRERRQPPQRAQGHELPRHPGARLRAGAHGRGTRPLDRRGGEPVRGDGRRAGAGASSTRCSRSPPPSRSASRLGAFNGFGVTVLKVPSLIVTLGTAAIARGLAFMMTQGVAFVGRWPTEFTGLARGSLGGVPNLVLWLAGVAAAAYVLLKWTRTGSRMRATGEADEAARLAGIATAAHEAPRPDARPGSSPGSRRCSSPRACPPPRRTWPATTSSTPSPPCCSA